VRSPLLSPPSAAPVPCLTLLPGLSCALPPAAGVPTHTSTSPASPVCPKAREQLMGPQRSIATAIQVTRWSDAPERSAVPTPCLSAIIARLHTQRICEYRRATAPPAPLPILVHGVRKVSAPTKGPGSKVGVRATSKYRGVTHHCRTGRFESHIWDCGKQVRHDGAALVRGSRPYREATRRTGFALYACSHTQRDGCDDNQCCLPLRCRRRCCTRGRGTAHSCQ
jgi:hypothetical protein